jgi:hypothetical protein
LDIRRRAKFYGSEGVSEGLMVFKGKEAEEKLRVQQKLRRTML